MKEHRVAAAAASGEAGTARRLSKAGADYLLAAAFSFFFCFLSLTESFGLLVPFGFS
jgi:hypothetical protein